ncbi:tRNA (5-methylaminomethyl-2-thiouridine)(34)-methyltransferase MnmD [Ohtaekwangia koreensis]|uniref:tRNA U34 5-methylaminomethyl-2-thiouridine-forming methyltransferase MnmC n=1 Tax=Ohtaekwangia koreensis TaxID=688867 RepID=A0A1T5LMW8_9BACT|nr:tRNA (5-methylaminomethyl-2-thiouridine)(34)-methyltransferase MnmD [Ohtaekwangia koreensis]SKC76889.1 tRNA U34 5-methylaminomethyl-2-thiouridine-forming methyltransferase MnmC [Ohtaekwangia koreensis]
MGIEIITTSDGSHSLLNTELDETYHSRHGAVQESIHVFIKEGLDYFLRRQNATDIAILEVGFGTGLNALLTLQRAQEIPNSIHYTSLETYPIPEEIWSKLNYIDSVGLKEKFDQLHQAPWNSATYILPNFELQKRNVTLQQADLSTGFDLIYFDAFAPNKQPEMWEIDVLKKVVDAMKIDGVFVTYCAKGQLKRDLKSLGLVVETLAGPPGKKEMVRGVKKS